MDRAGSSGHGLSPCRKRAFRYVVADIYAYRQLSSRQTIRFTPALGVASPFLLLSIPRPLKPPTSFLLALHLSQTQKPQIFLFQRSNLSAFPLNPLPETRDLLPQPTVLRSQVHYLPPHITQRNPSNLVPHLLLARLAVTLHHNT